MFILLIAELYPGLKDLKFGVTKWLLPARINIRLYYNHFWMLLRSVHIFFFQDFIYS